MRLIICLILTLVGAAFAEPFACMVAVTRQDASMDWWYAVPAEFTPKLSQISSVSKGEYFRIVPLFKNYGVTTNGHAHITYDFEVLRPDGSVDESLKGCVGYQGKVSGPFLIPGHAVLNLCFDPEDPYGDYAINVTAYDHVASLTNVQRVVVEQRKLRIETLEEEEKEQLFYTYAMSPNPTRALAAFLQTEQSFFDEETEPVWSAVWFFKTIFENNDYLVNYLLETFPKVSDKQQRDIILVLSLMDKAHLLPRTSGQLKSYLRVVESGRTPDPYDDITSGKQLDMLWGEYFATGTIRPVRQLITSLNLIEYSGTLEKIKAGKLDPKNLDVYRAGNLEAVFQSALWSLRSNCRQSPLVFQYCVGILNSEELEKNTQSCLGMLLQSVSSEADR